MTIPYALIPTVKIILRAVFRKLSSDLVWTNNIHSGSVTFYARGALALLATLEKIRFKNKQGRGEVWLPDYFCNEPVLLLKSNGFRLHFYPIKKDLSPNWEKIKGRTIDVLQLEAFVLVHYFGFPQTLETARDFCRQNDAVLIEDCAHQIIINEPANNPMIYSPRKFFPIPDGGILVEPGITQKTINYRRDSLVSCKWLILRLAQKIMLILNIPWHMFRTPFYQQKTLVAGTKIDQTDGAPNIFSLKLLSVMENDLAKIIRKRRQNYLQLMQTATWHQDVQPLFPNLPDNICPFMFPIIVQEGSETLIKKLRQRGIPASSWPDLPAEVLNDSADHSEALWLKKNILLLPIHQDLKEKQIGYLISCLNKVYEQPN